MDLIVVLLAKKNGQNMGLGRRVDTGAWDHLVVLVEAWELQGPSVVCNDQLLDF